MNTSAISALGAAGARPAAELSAPARAPAGPFNAAALRRASAADQRVAVAAQFEAVLVRQMLGKTVNSMLGGAESGVAGSVYGDMLADTIATQLTSGPGLGLGRLLVQQLTPRGETAAADLDSASVPHP